MIEVRILGPNDAQVLEGVAPDVFDHAVNSEWASNFLRDGGHRIAVALETGLVVGFASGVTVLHPDKPPELYIHEVGVAETHQRQGTGKRLVQALLEHARANGCEAAWVLTDRANAAANGLYAACGGTPEDTVLYLFPLAAP